MRSKETEVAPTSRWRASQNGTGSWKDKYLNKAGQVLDDNVYTKLKLDLSNPNPIYFHDRPIEPVAPELLVGFAYEMIAARIVSAIGATAVARAGINIAKNPEVVMKAPRVVVDIAKEGYASVARLFGRGGEESVAKSTNLLQDILKTAKPTPGKPNQIEALLDDGSKVIFRRDIGEYAHEIKRGSGVKVDHFNIEIQEPGAKAGRFNSIENLRIVVDENLNFVEAFTSKNGVLKNVPKLFNQPKP